MKRYSKFSYTAMQDSTAPPINSAAYSIYTAGCRAEKCLQTADYDEAETGEVNGAGEIKEIDEIDETKELDKTKETEEVERLKTCLEEIRFMAGLNKVDDAIDAVGGESDQPLTEGEQRKFVELTRERSAFIAVEKWRQNEKARLALLDEER
ncbi:hypothetical protein LMH87_001679 [Akanthomyces muscarius]|uniref:Uncharacterized protein n=1 Tax=Akanthomyces muscarius TaxID=2231603 RepID=A0A9W8Q5L1_AKAMU|nr:hypothetical protein LMH87_001679 [Akanthomyces muscarius]KAJ4147132.1 hypothetical protein LMH87_001679 [Akanthomyces muscarius]